ncbi:hypothetical protein BKA61DRAFT_645047 [Leptodontidium sp. MPI-SDFR-AT-0119]|nr:hypothetical protein BKA61DRAFT_645047 [Leptodontidium sp. MPI-SDFR-AT-0119]
MPSPNEIFAHWPGLIDNDFSKTITTTFGIPEQDNYVYRAEAFATALGQIQEKVDSGELKYKYQSHGQQIQVSESDINAYTSIFSSNTDSSKALTAFLSNAKKGSPREIVAKYLQSRRTCPFKIPKSKTHINPYYDMWALSCRETAFLGPSPDPSYAHPANAKHTHPILPVFYHHFGCVVPSYEALQIISQLVADSGVDGELIWPLNVTAVGNMASKYRTRWIENTVKADGVEYLKKNGGGKGRVLLMVYMVTASSFTKRVLREYRGDAIVMVGTQNANRYTDFADCTMEEYFEKEMPNWVLVCVVPMPSFAGKDEGMLVWRRNS